MTTDELMADDPFDSNLRNRVVAEAMRRGRRRRRHRVLSIGIGATMVIVPLALAGANRALSNRRSAITVSTGGPKPIPRLVPSALPPGFVLTRASNLIVSSEEVVSTLKLYGTARTPEQVAAAPLGLLTVSTTVDSFPGDRVPVSSGARPVTVRKHPAKLGITDDGTGFRILSWLERPRETVALMSRTFSDAQLLAAAETVSVNGDGTTSAAPAGLQLVLDRRNNGDVGFPADLGPPAAPKGWAVSYLGPHPTRESYQSLIVISYEADRLELASQLWWAGAHAKPRLVRGHPGFEIAAVVPGQTNVAFSSVTWSETDSSVASVSLGGMNISSDATLAIVESLAPANDSRWTGILSALDDAQLPASLQPGEQIAGRSRNLDHSWRLSVIDAGTAREKLCWTETTGQNDSSSCQEPHGIPPALTVGRSGINQPTLLYGMVSDAVTRIELVLNDKTRRPVEILRVKGSKSGYFIARIEGTMTVTAIVASDKTGAEIDRRPVPANEIHPFEA